MIENPKALTASSYASMLFLGVGLAIVGAAARNIGLEPEEVGLLISVQHLGFMLSILISGILADVFEKTKLLFVGSTILGISFLAFYKTPSLWANALIIFFNGIGIGVYEVVPDAMQLDIHEKNQSRYINLNHSFVMIGSAAITLYLIFLEQHWRSSVVHSGTAVLLLAAFFLVARAKVQRKDGKVLWSRIKDIPNKRVVATLFVITFLIASMNLGTIGFLTTFLVELRGFSQLGSKVGLLTFLIGIVVGRLAIGAVSKNRHITLYMMVLCALSVFLFTGLYYLDINGPSYIVIFLAGLTVSALFPLVISLGGIMFKDVAGTVTGVMKLAIPIGGIIIPLVVSLISRISSLQVALAVFPATSLIVFLIVLLNRKNFVILDEK